MNSDCAAHRASTAVWPPVALRTSAGVTPRRTCSAGKFFAIPIKGTHAHSWVMSFRTELESFAAYARAVPNNAIFLVDTYDSLNGVRHAMEVGEQLRALGEQMAGIRLDSGDLAYLSIEARKILDAGGFPRRGHRRQQRSG